MKKYYVILKEYVYNTPKASGFENSAYTMHCKEIPGLKIGDIIPYDEETDPEGYTVTGYSKTRRKIIAFSETPIGVEKTIK